MKKISIFLYHRKMYVFRFIFSIIVYRLSSRWSYHRNGKIIRFLCFAQIREFSFMWRVLQNFWEFLYHNQKNPIDRDRHIIFMIDRLWLLATHERERLNPKPNERETPESILTMQTERTRTRAMHVGHFTTGNRRHHPENVAVARRCLHRSFSLQVDLYRSCCKKAILKFLKEFYQNHLRLQLSKYV